MATNDEFDDAAEDATLKSTSADGESATWDTDARKALERDKRNRDPKAVVNGRTRPWIVNLKFEDPR